MRLSLFATAVVLVTSVMAERTVVVLYNNGVSEANSGSCTEADLIKTQAILSASGLNSTYSKRQLRAIVNDMHDVTESMLQTTEASHRALVVWPKKCKNACAGVTSGRCQESGCQGYRRRLHLDENDKRDLLSGVTFTCTQQVSYIQTELDKLVSQQNVSSNCQTLLSKPRNITCYDDVIYGVVEYIKLWDVAATPQKVLFDDFIGPDIFRSQLITFEAITNDCVDTLRTTLTGPNGYYADNVENNRPFSLYGDNVAKGKFFGRKLPFLGSYELTVVPDDIADKKKVVKFNVVPGTVTAVRLWNVTAKSILNANFTSGGTVCNGTSINFEAVMPDAASSKITLTSSDNGFFKSSTESTAPFSIFPNDSSGSFSGQKLKIGIYNLMIYPDQVDTDNVKSIQFNVVHCPS